MRRHLAIPFLMFLACEGSSNVQTNPQPNQQALVCSGSDVPIYRNRFAPQPGASGVATLPEAAAGVISSDAVGGAAPSAPTSGAIAADRAPSTSAPSTTAAPPADSTPAGTGGMAGGAGGSGAPVTAMDASCGQAPCAAGQVAVEVPPAVAGSTGGISTPAVGVAAVAADHLASTGPTATTSALTAPMGTLACTEPPPSCPEGQSPQFTSKKAWECTDCSLVVTYGGIYGNYRRCVNMPHLNCATGEVPTWVFENEQWECKTKCDNGQYDQHTVQGLMVCVPC